MMTFIRSLAAKVRTGFRNLTYSGKLGGRGKNRNIPTTYDDPNYDYDGNKAT